MKGSAPKTGYSRNQFGAAWADNVDVEYGRNSCRTREDILQRDLSNIVFKDDGKLCTVQSGTLVNDPYTGKTINFVRGKDTSSAIQIEHVVALSDAWQKGAQQLTDRERRNLANDPLISAPRRTTSPHRTSGRSPTKCRSIILCRAES